MSTAGLRAAMPAYVLGALSPEERADYEHALRMPEHASILRIEFDACQATANALASAQPVEPESGLLDRIMERIRVDAMTAGGVLHAAAPTVYRSPTDDIPGQDQPELDQRQEERETDRQEQPGQDRSWTDQSERDVSQPEPSDNNFVRATRFTPPGRGTRSLLPLMVPAVDPHSDATNTVGWLLVIALFAALGATGYYAATLRREAAAMETRLRENRVLLSRSDARLADRERLVTTLLGGRASVLLVNLRGDTPDGPVAQLFWNTRHGDAILNAFGLPESESGKQYRLWMIRDGLPTPLVVVTPDGDGNALIPDIAMPSSPTGVTQIFLASEGIREKPTAPGPARIFTGVISILSP